MNISFYDGINDGKFFNISAGKYDELGEEDIDISTDVEEEEEDDVNTCINRFAALEKDASKLHMDLNNLRNEFKGSCKDWNNLSDTVDHMLNSISELRTIMDRADDRLNKRLNVISEANVVLTDKLNLVEKKLEVFKCIDILDRVTKLEEKVKPTVLEEAKELEVRPSVLDDILDRLGNESIKNDILDSIKRLEEDSVSNDIQDDPVNHPSHYTDGKYETIDFIEEYGTITHIGNAIKYASRAGKKDEDAYIEDLKKGLWYLHRYNCPPKKKHIDVLDYCKEKKLPDELTNVLIAISRENYVEAERVLRKYIEELKK